MIIVLHGEDQYRSLKKLSSIKAHAATKSVHIVEYNVLEEEYSSVNALKAVLEELRSIFFTKSIFNDKKLVLIKNIFTLKEPSLKEFSNLFKHKNTDQEHIILFYEPKKIKASHKLFTLVQKLPTTKVELFDPLSGSLLKKYIQNRCVELDIWLTQEVIEFLISESKSDLFKINNGLNKLANYYLKDNNITLEKAKVFLQHEVIDTVFQLFEALMNNNVQQFLYYLNSMQQQGEEGIMVYGFLVSQFKKALLMKDLLHRGQDPLSIIKGNPYALKKLLSSVKNRDLQEMTLMYKKMAVYDKRMKLSSDPYSIIQSLVLN